MEEIKYLRIRDSNERINNLKNNLFGDLVL